MKALWIKTSEPDGIASSYWQYLLPGYGILGKVVPRDDKFLWQARVRAEFTLTGAAPIGLASTLIFAQHVVETLCEATGTVAHGMSVLRDGSKDFPRDPPAPHVVCWESPSDRGVKAMVEAAVGLLSKAEDLHGQPLYFDAEGREIDVDDVFAPTITVLNDCIKAGPAGGPWK